MKQREKLAGRGSRVVTRLPCPGPILSSSWLSWKWKPGTSVDRVDPAMVARKAIREGRVAIVLPTREARLARVAVKEARVEASAGRGRRDTGAK